MARTSLSILRRLALAFGLAVAATTAPAQGVSYDPPPVQASDPQAASDAGEAAPSRERQRPRRSRAEVRPYLEVAQIVTAELNGGDVFTYTSLAAGVDGRIETRRVRAQASYRYQRNIEWGGNGADQDTHSGLAIVNADIVPGLLQFDAGALAARTGGIGRALGVTPRDSSVEIYSLFAGPTLSTRIGPAALNAAYRIGYVAVDDDTPFGAFRDQYDDAIAHNLSASIGMGPGRLPFGWTLAGGYARSDNGGPFDQRFEGVYVRGDIVLPVGPTLALTAGVGYEDLRADQFDIARDADDLPILTPGGVPIADPSRPRLLTYDIDGLIYDAGLIWRPTPHTELQARAGRRYGGTTILGTFQHRFNRTYGVAAAVFDTVETFGSSIINNISNLPTDFDIVRNPFTGNIGGCAFGADPGAGLCFDQSLQSVRSTSFRARGATILVSGNRGLWSFGAGASYVHRRYARPSDPAFDIFGAVTDESFGLYATLGRELSRTSDLTFDAYASWFDSDLAGFEGIFSIGATATYSRRLLYDRLQLIGALGLYHTSSGANDSIVANGLIGLRYTF